MWGDALPRDQTPNTAGNFPLVYLYDNFCNSLVFASDKPKLRNILQDNWSTFFRTHVIVSRLKEATELRMLNARCDPGWSLD